MDQDTAAGGLLIKLAERRATLLGLDPPLGHAVHVVQHEPATKPTEKASAKEAAKRPELERVLNALEPGDVLVVTKLDRLARSTRDLLNIVDRIDTTGAKFRSLADAAFDTTTPTGKLMLTVLGGIAEIERSLILERANEGRAKAMAEGVQFGRKPKLTAHQRREIVKRLAAGENLAASYRVDQMGVADARLPPAAGAEGTAD